MARSYDFSIVQLTSGPTRGERLNIGVVVFLADGLDVRLGGRTEKLRAVSAAVDVASIKALVGSVSEWDRRMRDAGVVENPERLAELRHVSPLAFSNFGVFEAATSAEYEDRLSSLIRELVDPEPAAVRQRSKRSKLLTQVKSVFRRERVLASREDTLDSHRIIPGLEVDRGLVADLALKNGLLHVVETVDLSEFSENMRRAVADVGVAALVLDRARMKFGKGQTSSRLVYTASKGMEDAARPSLEVAQNQGAILINWESVSDRRSFVDTLVSLAEPRPQGSRGSEGSSRRNENTRLL